MQRSFNYMKTDKKRNNSNPNVQQYCCSVTQLCPTLCSLVGCSTAGFPVLHHLPELAQTHVH